MLPVTANLQINTPRVFKARRDCGVFIPLRLQVGFSLYSFVSFKQDPATSECTNVAPEHATLYLIPLVAVFVRVVPSAQPVPSSLRWSITGSPLFRCAQVSLRCERGAYIAPTAPLIMFLVYQIEAQPAVLSHSPFDTRALGGQSNTFLPGLRVRLGCYAFGVWSSVAGRG